MSSERLLPAHYSEYVIVHSEGFQAPDGSVAWEPIIKVTATETAPDGTEYVRDIAWFTPDDYGSAFAEAFVKAVTA